MAKSDNSAPFGDFSKRMKLSPDRQNLKPVDPKLTPEQYLMIAIKEGNALLNAEAKNSENSVKTPSKPDSVKLANKLGEMSTNAYVRARTEILNRMTPESRRIIEKMERGELTKDKRYDMFCKAVTIKGDELSK
jgi:hypothetical protein